MHHLRRMTVRCCWPEGVASAGDASAGTYQLQNQEVLPEVVGVTVDSSSGPGAAAVPPDAAGATAGAVSSGPGPLDKDNHVHRNIDCCRTKFQAY